MPLFRKLNKDEIDVRVGNISEKGLMLLLYKNARCDMNILDETVGPFSWQRKHYECKGNLFCSVGILSKDNEWIFKDDAGSESNTEKEKGEASDSFKRACTNWGIGRELYTTPFIWVSAKDGKNSENYKITTQSGKPKTYEKFKVEEIEYTNEKISKLVIVNDSNKKVYSFNQEEVSKPPKFKCCVCGKPVRDEIAMKSYDANNGKVYCSGTCKNKDLEEKK